MKILIAADMEGVSGVTTWDQVTPGHPEYERFRKVMTEDVNAAVRAAFDEGASDVIIADGHWNCSNILIERLDPRAILNSGSPSPFSMLQGLDSGVEAAIFVGYHARAGSLNGILDHTWSSRTVANLWLNGFLVGEYGLNGALCGHYNVPVVMISGDQTACSQAADLLGSIETAVVKQATGRFSAECLPLAVAQEKIYQAARRALHNHKIGKSKVFSLTPPIEVAIDLFSSDMGDKASRLTGVRRMDGRRIEFTAPDMVTAFQTFRAIVALALG